MKIKILIFFTLLNVMLIEISCAQISGPIPLPADVVAQPSDMPWINYSAGSLFGQGDVILNVDKFTGTAGINIPFYNYEVEGLNLGVSINYNTEGITVDKASSNVGLGWELNTGGYIYRQVRGFEDDYSLHLDPGNLQIRGLWNALSSGDPVDGEPDIFSASFAGRTIKFMFGDNGSCIVWPETNLIKIERYIGNSLITAQTNDDSNGDLSFVITDENGNQFHFRKVHYRMTYSYINANNIPAQLNHTPMYRVDRWELSKVKTYEGKEINYTYDDPDSQHEPSFISQNIGVYNNEVIAAYQGLAAYDYFFNRIKKISYPNNINVEFQYETSISRCDILGAHRLTEIDIKENHFPLALAPNKKSYIFHQAYFLSPPYTDAIDANQYINGTQVCETPIGPSCPAVDDTRCRLKLKSIDYIGVVNVATHNYYSFEYNPVPLPQRCYGSSDLFGFANNTIPQHYVNPAHNIDLYLTTPATIVNNNTVGIDRKTTTNVDYAAASSLIGITNGAGGHIGLNYRTNTAFQNEPFGVGGLILDKVTEFDGYNHDDDIITSYNYQEGEHFLPEGTATYIFEADLYNVTQILNSGCTINGLLDGSRYGFKKVQENTSDKNNVLLRSNIYKYSGLNDYGQGLLTYHDVAVTTAFGDPPFTNKQYLRRWAIGLLKSVERYDNNNRILNSENYTYSVSSTDGAFEFHGLRYLGFGYAGQKYVDMYYPITGQVRLTDKTTKTYSSDNTFLQKDESFDYFDDGYLWRHWYYNSKNELESDLYVYNQNYLNASPWLPLNQDASIDKLNNDGVRRLLTTIRRREEPTYAIGGNRYIVDSKQNGNVIVNGNIIRPNYLYDIKTDNLITENETTLPQLNFASLSSGIPTTYVAKIGTIDKYDDLGNAVEEADLSGSKYSSQIWDNQSGDLLAKVINAKYDEIGYCGFESDYDHGSVFLKGNFGFPTNGISTQYAMLGRCSYHVSDANQTTMWTTGALNTADPNKTYILSYWVYGNTNGVLASAGGPTIVMSPVSTYGNWTLFKSVPFHPQTATLGIWGEGYIDEMKLYPTDGQMNTYNYKPLCGKDAEVDLNDKIITYEYDEFGSIAVVRDGNKNIISRIKNVIQGQD